MSYATPQAAALRQAHALRGLTRRRVSTCRLSRVAPDVQLVQIESPEGDRRLAVRGLSTCGSVHSCAPCALPIVCERAREVSEAVAHWGHKRTAMVTLTLRHSAEMRLGVLRRVLARSYSRLKAGRAGKRLRLLCGHRGDVRGAEQTHGANGWHPHLHCLWFLQRAKDVNALRRLLGAAWQNAVEATVRWFHAQSERVREMSDEQRRHLFGDEEPSAFAQLSLESVLPTMQHGADVRHCAERGANYISKLGLEVAAVTAKTGAKRGQRTSWQVAAAAARGCKRSRALWSEHASAMKGARQLTWSRGARELVGLEPSREDRELARDSAAPTDCERCIATVPGKRWDATPPAARLPLVAMWHDAHARGQLDGEGPWVEREHVPDLPVQQWQLHAAGARGARGWRQRTTHVAQNPREPERDVYLSALLRELAKRPHSWKQLLSDAMRRSYWRPVQQAPAELATLHVFCGGVPDG